MRACRSEAAIGDAVRRDKEIETREKRRAQGVFLSLVARAVRSAIDGPQRRSVTNPVAGLPVGEVKECSCFPGRAVRTAPGLANNRCRVIRTPAEPCCPARFAANRWWRDTCGRSSQFVSKSPSAVSEARSLNTTICRQSPRRRFLLMLVLTECGEKLVAIRRAHRRIGSRVTASDHNPAMGRSRDSHRVLRASLSCWVRCVGDEPGSAP